MMSKVEYNPRGASSSIRKMGSLGVILAFLFLPLSFEASLAQEQALIYSQDFEAGDFSDWELEAGWGVIQEGDNHVLAGEGHHWARISQSWPGDFRLQFRLKLIRGDVHLVYRLNNKGRYFIGYRLEGSDLHKQYWPDTFIDGLAGQSAAHSLNQWHTIEIDGHGETLRFIMDGRVEWEYADPEPLLFGSFAFETLDESQAYIDDIQVFGSPSMLAPTPDQSLTWVRTGGPLGGLGYDVRMRPDNPDRMYVTDAYAGVFVSQDGGLTWGPSNQGISTRVGPSGDSIPVFCLTIDPHDPDIVWVGTQNVRGIFRSKDGGQTWNEVDRGVVENEGITFRGITVDPRSSEIVYAAAELSSWVWNGQPRSGREFDLTAGVVYKTVNGGEDWTAIWRGDNLARYIWIDPQDPDTLYVSTGIFDREAANSDPQTGQPGGEGVLKSTDGGVTWDHMNEGLNNLYVGTLFMHPENPEVLLAGTGNNQYYENNGVYLSTDGGASWDHVLKGDNITAVEFALSDPQIAYAGSSDAIYRSQDGAQTWLRVSEGAGGWGPPGVRAGFPIDFQVDPRDSERIFANEYGGGNFLSRDGGRTWQVASAGYTGAQVRDIVTGLASRWVYAAARSGLFISGDGGTSWEGLNSPPVSAMEWYTAAVDPRDSAHILAANNWEGVLLQSYDGGTDAWTQVSQRTAENISWRVIKFAPSQPNIVYAGSSAFFSAGTFSDDMPAAGIFRSMDGGKSWAPANDELSQDANVIDLAISSEDPRTLYAATGNHGLLKTTDGGQSWIELDAGIGTNAVVLSVALQPEDEQRVYLGLAFGGLYRSQDGGLSWVPAGNGLNPETSVSSIIFDPNDPQTLYLSDLSSGVYRSTDEGSTWVGINTGLRTRAVNQLAITTDGFHLYAATEGEGVFRLDLNGSPPAPAPSLTTEPPATIQASGATLETSPASTNLPPAVEPSLPTQTPASPPGGLPCVGALLLTALPLWIASRYGRK